MRKIAQNFVCFSETLNFNSMCRIQKIFGPGVSYMYKQLNQSNMLASLLLTLFGRQQDLSVSNLVYILGQEALIASRCEISGFCLLSFCQNERTQLCSVCILFEESVFIFQFLNDKIYNYVLFDIIVNFIIQKLKKHTLSSKSIQTEQS